MIHLRAIFFFVGWLLVILAGAMLIPCLFEYATGGGDALCYIMSSALSLFVGGLFVASNRSDQEIQMGKRDTFLLTTFSWLTLVVFSSMPFLFSKTPLSLTHAFFESVSGMTTTGATILSNIEQLPIGVKVWRAVLHWLGGIGIVVMALTIMAELRIGGLELFHRESSDQSEKLLPRIRQMTRIIFMSYIGLTVVCFVFLCVLGLSFVDAFCHALSCISTGGFANYDASIGHYNHLPLELVLGVFMVIGGCPQLLFARIWTGKFKQFFQDDQVRAYLKILAFMVLSIALWRILREGGEPFRVLVKTFFNVTSVLTTTGFSSEDYSSWGTYAMVFFFVVPFLGGCTGSTSGGLKIFRLQVMYSLAVVQLKKLRRPHGIFLPKFNGKELSESLFHSVIGFVMLFMMSFMAFAVVLGFLGLDFMTALSASASMLTNIGPGLGEVIGPAGNYASFSESVQWFLMVGMILGRLELLTLYVLLLPSFWRD